MTNTLAFPVQPLAAKTTATRAAKISPRKHVVITGTGRAGTTLLIELLTRCGLDTGFKNRELDTHISSIARAGLERDLRDHLAPYIVKSPWFCDYADEVLQREDIRIEHVLVPMRDLYAAAESRRHVQQEQLSRLSPWSRLRLIMRPKTLAGGLWHTDKPLQQEAMLMTQIYKLMYALSNQSIPITLLQYPRITQDSKYLFEKIEFLLRGMSHAEFDTIYRDTIREELVHNFQPEANAKG